MRLCFMLRFVEKPNLPEGRVKLLLIGEPYLREIEENRPDFSWIGVGKANTLPESESGHIDMQVVHLYRNKIAISQNSTCKVNLLDNTKCMYIDCKVKELVNEELFVIRGDKDTGEKYPKSAAYNVLLLDNLAVYGEKSIDFKLKQELISAGFRMIPVHQGYARCSVCVVQQDAVITADTGIAKALRENGIDVLQVEPGHIVLPGYSYGFIGGASFKLSKDTLAFTGHLNEHPDRDRIFDFAKKHGTIIVYLTKRSAFDIGTAIPLLEEV